MLIREFLRKYIDIVLEEDPLIILDSMYDMCMDKNGKDIKDTRHISRRVIFSRNGEN